MLIPNLNLADSVRQAYLDAWEQDQTPTFKSALDNFMKDAIVTLYSYGQYGKAREYFNIQRKKLKGRRRRSPSPIRLTRRAATMTWL